MPVASQSSRIIRLFQKTDFKVADFEYPANWIVPGALPDDPGRVIGTGDASVLPIWNLSAFSEVHFYTRTAGYTGPAFFGPRVYGYDQMDPHPGNYVTSFQSDGGNLPTGGGASNIILTNNLPAIASQAGTNNPVAVMALPLFAQFDIFYSGSPGALEALTSLRVSVYGIRRS